jgi:hypothetical protein
MAVLVLRPVSLWATTVVQRHRLVEGRRAAVGETGCAGPLRRCQRCLRCEIHGQRETGAGRPLRARFTARTKPCPPPAAHAHISYARYWQSAVRTVPFAMHVRFTCSSKRAFMHQHNKQKSKKSYLFPLLVHPHLMDFYHCHNTSSPLPSSPSSTHSDPL